MMMMLGKMKLPLRLIAIPLTHTASLTMNLGMMMQYSLICWATCSTCSARGNMPAWGHASTIIYGTHNFSAFSRLHLSNGGYLNPLFWFVYSTKIFSPFMTMHGWSTHHSTEYVPFSPILCRAEPMGYFARKPQLTRLVDDIFIEHKKAMRPLTPIRNMSSDSPGEGWIWNMNYKWA